MGDGTNDEDPRTLSFLRLWGIDSSTRTLTVETERKRDTGKRYWGLRY